MGDKSLAERVLDLEQGHEELCKGVIAFEATLREVRAYILKPKRRKSPAKMKKGHRPCITEDCGRTTRYSSGLCWTCTKEKNKNG